MTSEHLGEVAIALIMIALMLWAANIVRAHTRFLRNLLLPVSVIAGTLGLLLGPQVPGPLNVCQ